MKKFARSLTCVSTLALIAASAPAAFAQDSADEAENSEDVIIVTGSSLRGVAPVGSSLVTVSAEDLENTAVQTVQQALKTVPAVVGLNSPGQGGFGSFDGAGTNAPTIHSLGASASNSTLILLNGHRMPVGGANHVLADPNIIPTIMLQRVEVLSDGASSVYGSDAVAGVINFITRRNLDGLEANVQAGFGDSYGTLTGALAFGRTWETGSFIVGYSYGDRDNLAASDRAFTEPNRVARGGWNFRDNNCGPAGTLTTGGLAYYGPYTSPGAAYVAAGGSAAIPTQNGRCETNSATDLIPSETRHNLMASIQQDVGDALTVTADFIYSNKENVARISRGNANGTVYLSGAPTGNSNNPFAAAAFTALNATRAGSSLPAVTSATVNFNGDALLGEGAQQVGRMETFYGRVDLDYEISEGFNVNLGGLVGRDISSVETIGRINPSGFQLALNGRAAAVINGVSNVVTQTLTATNALDVFGGGSTSAATLANLTDSRVFQVGNQTIVNVYGKVEASLFELPGGTSRLAVGGEFSQYDLDQDTVQPNGLGAASFNSLAYLLNYGRDVTSGYAELYLPLIGPDQEIPLVREFNINISGRIDSYSDVGSTTNPKIAADWEVFDGFRIRGNWAESFVAPALTSIGSNAQGRTGESSFGAPGNVTLPYSIFPTAAQIPGCVATATSCTVVGSSNGIQLNGGNGNLVPQTGTAWSVGVDLAPPQLDGFRLSVTYWSNRLRGGITAPQLALVTGSAALSQYLTVYPTGATVAQIAGQTATLPQTATVGGGSGNSVSGTVNPIYFIYSNQQQNVLNLNVAGIDVSASYAIETESMGNFNLGVGFSRKTKFDQFFGTGGTVFSVLGYAGYNLTFPSLKYEGRYSLGWENGPFEANLFVNHTGGYTFYGASPVNPRVFAAGLPSSGGDRVSSFVTIDTHFAYTVEDFGPLASAQLFLDATNLLDEEPPFMNVAVGYDTTNANPIGRVVTIGLRTEF